MKTVPKLCLPFLLTLLAFCNVDFSYAQKGERGGHSDRNTNSGSGQQSHSDRTYNQGNNTRTTPIYREPNSGNRNGGSGDGMQRGNRNGERTSPPVSNGGQSGQKHINSTPPTPTPVNNGQGGQQHINRTPPTEINPSGGLKTTTGVHPITNPPATTGDQNGGRLHVNPNPTPLQGGGNNTIHPNPAVNPVPTPITPTGGTGVRPVSLQGGGSGQPNRILPPPVAHYNYDNRRDFRGYGDRRHIWYTGYHYYRYRPNYWFNISFGGYPYYYWDGYYYSYWEGYYRPMYPPCGIRVHYLPYGYYPVYMDMDMYYYYEGIYYRHYNDNYEVVDPPLGAKVPKLPKHAKSVNVNGEKFYELNGTYYKEVLNVNNEVLYEVVGKNGEIYNTENLTNTTNTTTAPAPLKVGDILNQLPANCKSVMINGEKLYVSPSDVYFKEEVDASNKVNYKVVGTGL
jgi:hypothetical protein